MLKLLVKKQLSEIFRVYFYDAKKNKARSKVSTIMFMLWFAVIMTGVLGGIILTLLISVFVMMLSCLLGYVVAKVSLKLKHKSMITVLVSLVFIVGYYFVYFKAQSMITELLTNLTVYGDKIKGSAYLLFAFGSVGVGGVKATLIMLTLVAVTFLMMCFLISKSFLQVATSTGKVSKVVYHKKTMKQESVTKALLFREFWHFTSSPGYMLNSGLGIFLMPVCAAGLI